MHPQQLRNQYFRKEDCQHFQSIGCHHPYLWLYQQEEGWLSGHLYWQEEEPLLYQHPQSCHHFLYSKLPYHCTKGKILHRHCIHCQNAQPHYILYFPHNKILGLMWSTTLLNNNSRSYQATNYTNGMHHVRLCHRNFPPNCNRKMYPVHLPPHSRQQYCCRQDKIIHQNCNRSWNERHYIICLLHNRMVCLKSGKLRPYRSKCTIMGINCNICLYQQRPSHCSHCLTNYSRRKNRMAIPPQKR